MATPADLPQKRVLVVDDSRFVRTTFATILKTSFGVREEADGDSAWQAVETDPSIVMVLTDLDMPRLDGYGLLRASAERTTPACARFRSSSSRAARTLRPSSARDLGANDFIGKSADAPEVLARLDNVLRLVRASEEATHDALTGADAALPRHGGASISPTRAGTGELSAMALRLDTYDEIVLCSRAWASSWLARSAWRTRWRGPPRRPSWCSPRPPGRRRCSGWRSACSASLPTRT